MFNRTVGALVKNTAVGTGGQGLDYRAGHIGQIVATAATFLWSSGLEMSFHKGYAVVVRGSKKRAYILPVLSLSALLPVINSFFLLLCRQIWIAAPSFATVSPFFCPYLCLRRRTSLHTRFVRRHPCRPRRT